MNKEFMQQGRDIFENDPVRCTKMTLEMMIDFIPNDADRATELALVNEYARGIEQVLCRYISCAHMADHDCEDAPRLLDMFIDTIKGNTINHINEFVKWSKERDGMVIFNPFEETPSTVNQQLVEEILQEENDE